MSHEGFTERGVGFQFDITDVLKQAGNFHPEIWEEHELRSPQRRITRRDELAFCLLYTSRCV